MPQYYQAATIWHALNGKVEPPQNTTLIVREDEHVYHLARYDGDEWIADGYAFRLDFQPTHWAEVREPRQSG